MMPPTGAGVNAYWRTARILSVFRRDVKNGPANHHPARCTGSKMEAEQCRSWNSGKPVQVIDKSSDDWPWLDVSVQMLPS